MDGHRTDLSKLQASLKQAQDTIAEKGSKIEELRTEALQVESESETIIQKHQVDIGEITNKLRNAVNIANHDIGNGNQQLKLYRNQAEQRDKFINHLNMQLKALGGPGQHSAVISELTARAEAAEAKAAKFFGGRWTASRKRD